MITRHLLKKEIDKVREEHLTALYNIIKVLGLPEGAVLPGADLDTVTGSSDWEKFIRETYGCLQDDPIERGSQGEYEIREEMQ